MILSVLEIDEEYGFIVYGWRNRVFFHDLASGRCSQLHLDSELIRSAAFWSVGRATDTGRNTWDHSILALTLESKDIVYYTVSACEGEEGPFSFSGRAVMASFPKLIDVMLPTGDGSVLLGDRSGDVFLLPLVAKPVESLEDKVVSGHLSCILDMKMVAMEQCDDRILLTSDRDEKIRASWYPNLYDIQCIFLGHKDMVTSISWMKNTPYFVSGSIDGTICMWNIFYPQELKDVRWECSGRPIHQLAVCPIADCLPGAVMEEEEKEYALDDKWIVFVVFEKSNQIAYRILQNDGVHEPLWLSPPPQLQMNTDVHEDPGTKDTGDQTLRTSDSGETLQGLLNVASCPVRLSVFRGSLLAFLIPDDGECANQRGRVVLRKIVILSSSLPWGVHLEPEEVLYAWDDEALTLDMIHWRSIDRKYKHKSLVGRRTREEMEKE
eukprot:TRINITY_DN685_c0_g1_i1.p1 TRINITY_DN685_c0_g1~~TRINITY_DN685_c0_g1_i1.p1  ORF type:complete len:437 (-),score=112.35 TRINITY_DN685_c0_g1_i1:85-1395(-)